MNEVPRWAGGYGMQVFQEFRWADDLYDGDSKAPNPKSLRYQKFLTHIEGVYTHRSWIRITAKLPYIRLRQKPPDVGSTMEWQEEQGWGDMTLAVPIRRYINRQTHTGHLGIVPQLRVPSDKSGSPYQISDGSTDLGISFTSECETPSWIAGIDSTYWWEQNGSKGNEFSIDTALGWNFKDNASLRWETEYIRELGASGNTWLAAGPTLFWNFNDIFMGRIEYKFSVWEHTKILSLARGDSLRIGIGCVF